MDAKKRPPLYAIVGPKHVGKSTVGARLAALLGGRFLDLDHCVEVDSGKSPRTLYQEGAEVFRREEAASLVRLLAQIGGAATPVVLATGGGIVDNIPAWEALRARAFIILLDLDASGAFERILETSREKGLPSFLRTENPAETHRILHEDRMARYRSASAVIVQVAFKSPEENARAIFNTLATNLLDPCT